jgi:hypothetical protein
MNIFDATEPSHGNPFDSLSNGTERQCESFIASGSQSKSDSKDLVWFRQRTRKQKERMGKSPGNILSRAICHYPRGMLSKSIKRAGSLKPTVAEYTSIQAVDHMAMELTRFDGVSRLKKQVREALAEVITQEAA